jgi:uncharacterized membrane protein
MRNPADPRSVPEPAAKPTSAAGPASTSSLELALAHVLQLGTYTAVALIGIGVVLLIASGGSPLTGTPPFDLATIPGDIAAVRPAGFLWLGIAGVLATPAVRVGRALLGFARRGERRMVAVSAGVLVVIAVGVVVGVMAR